MILGYSREATSYKTAETSRMTPWACITQTSWPLMIIFGGLVFDCSDYPAYIRN